MKYYNDYFTGYDNIPVSLAKPVAEYIASPLAYIINNCIKIQTFPSQWKIATLYTTSINLDTESTIQYGLFYSNLETRSKKL